MLDDVINKDDTFVEDSTCFGELDDTQIMLTHLVVNLDQFHALVTHPLFLIPHQDVDEWKRKNIFSTICQIGSIGW